jgi:hypothetical protein
MKKVRECIICKKPIPRGEWKDLKGACSREQYISDKINHYENLKKSGKITSFNLSFEEKKFEENSPTGEGLLKIRVETPFSVGQYEERIRIGLEIRPPDDLWKFFGLSEKEDYKKIPFCAKCVYRALWPIEYFQPPQAVEIIKTFPKPTRKQMESDLKRLVDLLGYIPNQRFKEGLLKKLVKKSFSFEEAVEIIHILYRMPPYDMALSAKEAIMKNIHLTKDMKDGFIKQAELEENVMKFAMDSGIFTTYKKEYGSWLNALIQAKVVDSVRKTPRGTMCLANDGHVCRSISEKIIDDWFSKNNIQHEKEVWYPKVDGIKKSFRADWKVGEYYIEFFGLIGQEDYDNKTKDKIAYCKERGIKLILIYQKDVQNLDEKLQFLRSLPSFRENPTF